MKIGNITVSGDLILPAIAGYGDAGMRMLARRYGAALTFTEMVSAKALVYGNNNTKTLLHTAVNEDVKGIQLFGSEPYFFAKAIRLPELDKFDIIDINMGCPMPKIYKNGEGSALMRNPVLVREIVEAAVSAAGERPVTVKIRAGFSAKEINAPEIASAAEDGGASAVTVHGRTRDMLYGGKSDNGIIAKVKNAVKIPVIGNGDVIDRESYLRMKEETGADGVAVARAAVGRPYVFAEITSGEKISADIKSLVTEHLLEILRYMPERQAVNSLKKHISAYYKGVRGGKEVKLAAFKAENIEELLDCLI